MNQYLVEFLVEPGEASGFRPITIESKIRDMELMAPEKVWVAAPMPKPAPRGREH